MRADLLGILFFRLSETDPQSALAVARTDQFRSTRSIERIVWRTWARKNLDDALFAAKTQTSRAEQNSAAQSLYAAFGFMGNETTDKIEAELGIGPDRSTRAQYIYWLADKSPNLREGVTLVTGGVLLFLVITVFGEVSEGARPEYQLLDVIDGLPIAFQAEPLGAWLLGAYPTHSARTKEGLHESRAATG